MGLDGWIDCYITGRWWRISQYSVTVCSGMTVIDRMGNNFIVNATHHGHEVELFKLLLVIFNLVAAV